MNFPMNVSGNQFRYNYDSTGVYNATFVIKNMLGSKVLNLRVPVQTGISTLVLNFPSAISIGSSLTVQAYLVIALSSVTYTWSFDSHTATTLRTCLFY